MEIWSHVLRTMNENSSARKTEQVHVAVCDSDVDCSSLAKCVKKLYPKRALFLSAVPTDVSAMSSKVERARSRGWLGDACFFVLSEPCSIGAQARLDIILSAITRGFVTAGAIDGKTVYWRPYNLWLVLGIESEDLPWKIRWSPSLVRRTPQSILPL